MLLILSKFKARGTTKATRNANMGQIKRTRSFRQHLEAKITANSTKSMRKLASEMAYTRLHTHYLKF